MVGEVLKSWWHRGKDPTLYHYRDKDGREVDLLIACDGKLYPLEIKKAVAVKPGDARAVELLSRRGAVAGAGAVISLCPEATAVTRTTACIPIGWL